MIKKLRYLFTLMLLFVASVSWAKDVTFEPSNFSGQGTSGTGSEVSATIDGVTFSCDKGYGTDLLRCYSGGMISITSEETITSISFTFSGKYNGGLSTSYSSINAKSWTNTLSSQARISKVVVKVGNSSVTFEHAGTEADPYNVSDARKAIDAGVGTTDVYATGIVSEIVTAYNSTYGNITFDIVDEEGAATSLRAYRCSGTDAANVQVGDIAVVKGNLILYGSTYEFNTGCELVSLTHTTSQLPAEISFSATTAEADLANISTFTAPTFSNPHNLAVTFTSSKPEVATVSADGTVTILAEGKTTITATSEETETYFAGTASYTLTVTNSNKQLVTVDADGNITFDLSDNGWRFPEGSSNKTTEEGSYSSDGYTITLAGGGSGNGHYFATGYLLMGKSGATLTLPAFNIPVGKIQIVGRSGASSGVKQNIYVGESAASAETTGAEGTNEYIISEVYQAAGNVYTLKVTSDHNTQITKIIVYKAVVDERSDAEISFSPETLNITKGEDYDAPTFNNPNKVTVTFSSDNENVATWDNGLELGTATGTAIITATFAGDDNYKPAAATLTVKVTEDLNFVDVVIGNGIYQKITSASELEAGKRYLIVYETEDNDLNEVADVYNGVENKIGKYVEMPRANNKVDNSNGTATHPVVLQSAGDENWYLMDGENFLYYSGGSNELYISNQVSQAGNVWSINFGEEMSIKNVNTPERYLQFNAGSPRFACYKGTQKNVILYKELSATPEPETVEVSIGGVGMATFSSTSALDFTGITTIAAYTARVTSDGAITFNRVMKVPANTGLLIRNADGEDKGAVSADVPVLNLNESADDVTGNALVAVATEIASLPTTVVENGSTNYILNKKDGKLGFYKANGKKVGAGKAYLNVPAGTSPAKDFIGVDDNATGIEGLNVNENVNANEVFDLQGRRVARPTKGIYIVNGKKVVVK